MESGRETEVMPKTRSALRDGTLQTSTGSGGTAEAGVVTRMTAHADGESEAIVEIEMKNTRTRSAYLFVFIYVDTH